MTGSVPPAQGCAASPAQARDDEGHRIQFMADAPVVRLGDVDRLALMLLLRLFGLNLCVLAPQEEIPGSYWGDSEAGLQGDNLYVRQDTPLHSALHEACHYICMTPERRAGLDTDAGGDHPEECGVCYLQIVIGGLLPGVGQERMMRDMDTWGYSFRLGSARAWFEQDAGDARQWLLDHGIMDAEGEVTGEVRV